LATFNFIFNNITTLFSCYVKLLWNNLYFKKRYM